MNKLDYVLKAVTELTANPRNARTHSKDQIKKIAASIKEFGFIAPAIIDKDGVLVAGHGRLEAAKKLKMDAIPCVIADHLTPEQLRAYMLADNRIQLDGGWDEEILKIELSELTELDFDLSFTGFESHEIFGATPLEVMPEIQSGEKSPFQQITFTLHDEQAEIVRQAMALSKTFPCSTGEKNQNGNGNALFVICERFIKQNANG